MAIINDDLTGSAVTCGSLVCGVITGAISWAIGYAFYGDEIDNEWERYGLLTCIAVVGGVMGLIMTEICLHPLPSAVQALFVCWAEEPELLAENRPSAYEAMSGVRPEMRETVPQQNYPAGKPR